MFKKIKLAKTFLTVTGNYKASISLSLKCFFSYIFYCILLRKNTFVLKYNGKYIKSFKERLADWLEYIWYNIGKIFLKIFKPNSKILKDYMLFPYKIYKPCHVKVTNGPAEALLSYYLKEKHFKIIDEHDKLLKSDNLVSILEELNVNEENIVGSIKFYNDTVVDFNQLILSFPSSIIAFIKRYKKKEFYSNEKREIIDLLNAK